MTLSCLPHPPTDLEAARPSASANLHLYVFADSSSRSQLAARQLLARHQEFDDHRVTLQAIRVGPQGPAVSGIDDPHGLLARALEIDPSAPEGLTGHAVLVERNMPAVHLHGSSTDPERLASFLLDATRQLTGTRAPLPTLAAA